MCFKTGFMNMLILNKPKVIMFAYPPTQALYGYSERGKKRRKDQC